MFEIAEATWLAENVKRFAIRAPRIACKQQAGQLVIVRIHEHGERIPLLDHELRDAVHELFVTTDDGSYGQRGLVTDKLRQLIDGERIDLVFAVGPIPMMRGVAEVTRPHEIPTTVSLNSIMVDGTGMCGGCRVVVGGESRCACVDGPEFDAHQVDFEVLTQRNAMSES